MAPGGFEAAAAARVIEAERDARARNAAEERAREAVAVVAKGGLYEWVCLPMGPINGPQAFQAAMEKAFCSGGPGSANRTVFIDDVTVYTGKAGSQKQ